MHENSFKVNNTIYFESVSHYPHDHRGVKWSSHESQFKRFEILCGIAEDLFTSQLLDVGCGLGHLTDYLLKNRFSGSYKGIDIVNEMILGAKRRHPTFDYETNDIDSIEHYSYDYVLASGLLAFVDLNTMQTLINEMFKRARRGLAFNGLNIHAEVKEKGMMFYDPQEVVAFCKTMTPHVILRENYLPNDFTIYMNKNSYI